MNGIVAFGAYVPRLRLQRQAIHAANGWFAPGLKALAKGERAIAGWDEDSVTMAVEAARDCLGTRPRDGLAALLFASTTPPFADRQNAGIVKEALTLPDAVATIDLGGSAKAGTGMLLQALQGIGPALCVASERRLARPASEAEMTGGDGAAAFLVGADDPIARLVASHSLSIDFVDHFRGQGVDFDYGWEARWVRDEGYAAIAGRAIREALAKAHLAGDAIDRFVAPISAAGVPRQLARAAGIRDEAVHDPLSATLGNTGSAHPLVMLADALAEAMPGERLLVLGFGQGADVLILEVTDAIRAAPRSRGVAGWLARRRPETNYLKYLTFAGHLELDRGMRAEFDQKQPLSALYRNRRTVLGLVGGRCPNTGAVQYPRSERAVDPAVTGPMEDYPLADVPARVLTFTADSLGYSPDPPGHYGMIAFDGGGRMACEFTDVDPGMLEVGQPMRMMFRIKARDERRGFTKIFLEGRSGGMRRDACPRASRTRSRSSAWAARASANAGATMPNS